jgi:hypothetical protein
LRGKLIEDASLKYFVGGDFPDPITEDNALSQHLVVKHEVVRILEKRKIGQHLSAEGAETSVILRKLRASENNFEMPSGNGWLHTCTGHTSFQTTVPRLIRGSKSPSR